MSGWRNALRKELALYKKETGRSKLTLDEIYDFSLSRLKDLFPDNDNPEAKIRQQLRVLRDNDEIEFINDDGFYRILSLDFNGTSEEKRQSKTEPKGADEFSDNLDFEVGQRYNREELHDVYGGQRYRGIATPKDYPAVFLFTGESGKEYGYQDEFKPDGRFIYTGEGTEGNMTWDEGNAAIRDHKQNGEEVHVFEDTDEAWVVTYVGEFEYVAYRTRMMDDENGNPRRAFRFELEPVGGEEIETENPDQLDLEELYERAKQSSPTEPNTSSTSSGGDSGRSYPRSEIVRRYALREADGVCQGCGEDAPFTGKDGEPFLEVHHLYRRADGGADDPDNVVALCPNCHRRRHYGEDGDEFNQQLIAEKETS
jgi:5-methylcytosine-specific restriction protein A